MGIFGDILGGLEIGAGALIPGAQALIGTGAGTLAKSLTDGGGSSDGWTSDADGNLTGPDGQYYDNMSGIWYDQNGNEVSPAQASQWSKLASAAGAALGGASQVASNNRNQQESFALQQEGLNTSGQSAYESELMNRAQEEQALKDAGLQDLGTANTLALTANRASNPRVSPFDPVGAPKYSPSTLQTLNTNAAQAEKSATSPNLYGASTWSPLKPFTPINLANVQGATGTAPSGWSNAANVVAPALKIGSSIDWSKLFPDGVQYTD